ncbi:MAG: SDR family NAD(P)-dependent oxidoreductase [Deltaproteobacteria bacterium]|nr:SDR family NAD(P)-dependent oxidoreductase [Deltaproteobacteria bacterium]
MTWKQNLPRTVLITGASAGIGEACARKFAAAGCKLILTGRRRERLEALAQELPTSCLVLCFDIRNEEDTLRELSDLPAGFAEVDVLVNNAGLALGLDRIPAGNPSHWQQMIDTNISGMIYATRAVLPGMVQRGRGHLIQLGSVAGTYPYPGGAVYAGTKAFVHQHALGMRSDLIGTPIRVTSIEPGAVETEFALVRFEGDKSRADAVYHGFRPLNGADIAESIFWAATAPAHVNINVLEIMPVAQAFGGFAFDRR